MSKCKVFNAQEEINKLRLRIEVLEKESTKYKKCVDILSIRTNGMQLIGK